MFIEIRFPQTRYQLKRNYYSQKLKIPNSGKVAPCTAKQIPKQAALTIQRITSVHFKPEFIGCHLNIWLKMAHTRLTKGIPTSKIPAMYITMADSGEVGSTTSAIGKREMRAAPPPTATAIAANNSATNTTPNTNSIGLQIMANITRQIFNSQPTTITSVSPNFCKKVRGLSDSYNHSPRLATFSKPSVTVFPIFSTVTASPRMLNFSAAVRASGIISQHTI